MSTNYPCALESIEMAKARRELRYRSAKVDAAISAVKNIAKDSVKKPLAGGPRPAAVARM